MSVEFDKFLKRLARKLFSPFIGHRTIMMRPDDRSRQGLLSLMDKVDIMGGVMVEIGSYRGESASVFWGTGRLSRLYCVDPWKKFYDDDDGAAFTDMKRVEEDFDSRHASNPGIVKVKGTIDDYVERYPNESVDIVYIDGLHTYEGVKHDIEVTMQKIKPRKAIAGHDYDPYWPAYRAINEIFGKPDITFEDGSWVKFSSKQ